MKTNSSFINFEIKCQKEIVDELSDFLFGSGALSVSVEDFHHDSLNEIPVFIENIAHESPLWPHCLIKALFKNEQVLLRAHKIIIDRYGENNILINTATLPDVDWVQESRKSFKTIKISDNLWIIPSWDSEYESNAINIRLDPSLAFGTGNHPTTFLCLKWMEDNMLKGHMVLDYGCGSGILAIAAMKLGAISCDAVDIDPMAIKITKDNASKNEVSISAYTNPDEIKNKQYDLVVANILANPLKQFVKNFADFLKFEGKVLLSGILKNQVDEIVKVYSLYFDIQNVCYKNNWAAVIAIKKK